MKTFIVGEKESNIRLDKYIMKKAPKLPRALLYKFFRNSCVKVNGKRCRDFSVILQTDDSVDLYISDEFFEPIEKHYDFLSSKQELCIVFEDENIIL